MTGFNKLEAQGTCTIDGIDQQATFWKKHIVPLKKLKAVLIVDGLRFELGCDFQERFINLGLDADAGILWSPIVAAAPTLTAIGIGSIISGEDISIEVTEGGKWLISETHDGKLENLSTKESRKQSLRRKYPKTIFFDLQDISNPSELTVKDASLIVVFTQELDAGGHDSGALRFY